MITVEEIGTRIDTANIEDGRQAMADAFLSSGVEILEAWLRAHDKVPTMDEREGFRLLALHHQGARGDPGFNACRETCRELAYHYNIAVGDYQEHNPDDSLRKMRHIARHLYLFISGKLQDAELGDFCCSSKNKRANGA